MSKEDLIPEAKSDEKAVPELFNINNLFTEYRATVFRYGTVLAADKFQTLLRKQLITLIQEMNNQPVTPTFLYQVEFSKTGEISVHDHDYPIETNIVKRSDPKNWYHLPDEATVTELYQVSSFAKNYLDRFLLEYEQIKNLVSYISEDKIFSLSITQLLAQLGNQVQIDIDGISQPAIVSNWYSILMPATKVHKGARSYFNIYRIVCLISAKNEIQFFVQKQGLLQKFSKENIQTLANLDQPHQQKLNTEAELMSKINQLNPRGNRNDAVEVITEIGSSFNPKLQHQIEKAKIKQQLQQQAVENAIKTIISIFNSEIKNPHDQAQALRLKIFLEGIINPLHFAKDVPQQEIIKQYHATLGLGKDRNALISALSNSMPSMLYQAAGNFFCGGISAGGLTNKGITMNNSIHNHFKGLDNCLTCPACGNKGVTGNLCKCGFSRGQSLANFSRKRSKINTPSAKKGSSVAVPKTNSVSLTPKKSVSVNYFFSAQTNSVGLGYALHKPQ